MMSELAGGDPIVRELRALAPAVAWPPTPDEESVAAAVALRAAHAGSSPSRRPLPFRQAGTARARALAIALVTVVLATGVAFAVPPARTALLDLLGLRGAVLVRVESLPPAAESGAAFAQGVAVSLAEARRRAGFAIRLPALGPPAAVVLDAASGTVVITWGSPVRVRLVELSATYIVEKVAASGTRVRRVDVDGAPGAWLSGAPHVVLNLFGEPAIAGSTLLWERGGVTYRLDGRLDLAQALGVARSVR
jgi:hypothetical protein